MHSPKRYAHYFKLGYYLFRKRKSIDSIVSMQQFYGIVFSFFCSLFHGKHTTKNIIISFIYNEKSGAAGKLYHRFIERAVSSPYVDQLIVHSKSEVDYYAKLFPKAREKFIYVPLGITDDSAHYYQYDENEQKEKYILSVGNSNRDFDFLMDSLKDTEYKVRIFSDRVEDETKGNITTHKGVSVPEYYKQMSNCFCSVIPLSDPNISSGQLVMLQSYAFKKPVIITASNVNQSYTDQQSAIVIDKTKGDLLAALQKLEDEEYYDHQISAAHDYFEQEFSMEAFGKHIGEVYNVL